MSNVIGLPGVNVPKNDPDETSKIILEYLADLLDRVREGEVRTFAIATLNMDGTGSTRIIGSDKGLELLGVVAMLQHDLVMGITESATAE